MQIPKLASKIDLSHQHLTEIPSEVFECKNLKKLNLSNNNIKNLPKELSNLKFLKNLDLSNNKISQLYAKFFDLKNLEILNLNNNQLKKLPEQIGNLKKLKKLSVSSNILTELPQTLRLLHSLNTLNISNNAFADFPEEILSLSKLKYLWLGKNPLKTFSSSDLLKLKELQFLYCFNPVSQIELNLSHDYHFLSKKKGNSIGLLKIIPKERNSTMNNKKKGTHIFISYSHKDLEFKNEIEISLRGIKNIGLEFDFWNDEMIKPGSKWKKQIDESIEKSTIAINILSRDYLASDFISKIELPAILSKQQDDGMVILNVIARRCVFDKTTLAEFQSINDPKKPIQGEPLAGQEEIYDNLTRTLIELIEA